MAIDPNITLGPVTLTVADLARSLAYYQDGLGLLCRQQSDGQAILGTAARELLILVELPGARPLRGYRGLYHFALRLPDRPALGRTLKHLAEAQVPISGWSDHAVSEAIYLTDPDGHGIELYRDRPRSEWPYSQGQLQMTTEALDVSGVLDSWPGPTAWAGLAPATVMGHMHLHVPAIDAAERFYVDGLGLELMVRYGTSASFLAAGGYHHHLGINTWAGLGAPPPPADGARLLQWQLHFPSRSALDETLKRLHQAGVDTASSGDGYLVRDPAGSQLALQLQPGS